jgi:hypothetical protein
MFLDDFNILILKINFFNIFLNKNILKNNYYRTFHHLKSVFGNVIVVTFQIAFRAEIHVNDIFYILKSYLTSAHQNDLKNINYTQF